MLEGEIEYRIPSSVIERKDGSQWSLLDSVQDVHTVVEGHDDDDMLGFPTFQRVEDLEGELHTWASMVFIRRSEIVSYWSVDAEARNLADTVDAAHRALKLQGMVMTPPNGAVAADGADPAPGE